MIPGILLPLIYYENRLVMRIQRRQLRDTLNPFEIPEPRFREIYRFPPVLAIRFIGEISEYITEEDSTDPRKVPLHLQVLSVLNFLASGSYQRRVGMDAFALISQTMVSRFIKNLCELITKKLCPTYVKFPDNEIQASAIKDKFQNSTHIPGIVGLIDGTQVALVNVPREHENEYVNRKGYHSVNLQVICDENLQIISANARYPGSVHDSHVFESSRVKVKVRELNAQDPHTWLIGDSAYALKPYMIVPFRNPSNDQERKFNDIHTTVRHKIERCFAVLKGRWRCLTKARALHYTHARAFYIIYAAIVCHNYLILHNVPILDIEIFDDEYDDSPNLRRIGHGDNAGRQFLMNFISEHNIQY